MSGQRLFRKSVLIFIFNFGLCLGADDLPPELANLFTVERTQELSGEALYADIADETGDYVLILKKNNSENTVKYFTADGLEMWQKDFARKEAVWIDISENSETVMVQGWGIVNIFDKEGGLLLTKQRYMTSYFLSPNGKYIIEQNGDSWGDIHYFTILGEMKKIKLPEELNAPLYYLRFTSDSKILALFTGQETKPFQPKKTRGKPRKKFVRELMPGIATDSHLILYDPDIDDVKWIKKIRNGPFVSQGFQTRQSAASKDFLLLFNDIQADESRGLYCYSTAGDFLWFKSDQEILPGDKLYVSSMLISNNNNDVCVYDGRGYIFIVELETGNTYKIRDLQKDVIRSNSYQVFNFTDENILLAPDYVEERVKNNYIYSFNVNGKLELRSMFDGGLFLGKNRSILLVKNNNLLLKKNGTTQ